MHVLTELTMRLRIQKLRSVEFRQDRSHHHLSYRYISLFSAHSPMLWTRKPPKTKKCLFAFEFFHSAIAMMARYNFSVKYEERYTCI